jgi:thioredoxin reductase (NADPH)
VFAAGDVRFGSVKRIASAVGEGAVAVQEIEQYLAPGPQARPAPRATTDGSCDPPVTAISARP